MNNLLVAEDTATIGTDELLAIINAARLQYGENTVRNNDFINRVKDELDGEHYEITVVQNLNKTEFEYLRITTDQAMLVSSGGAS